MQAQRTQPGWPDHALRFGVLCIACLLAACRTPAPRVPAQPPPAAVAPSATRGEFTIAATKLDTWNAVGQIVVHTPGAEYEGRSQMLDLYTVRYRDQPFLLLTRALRLSDTIKDTTTLVTARTLSGHPIDNAASADLLALLQRALPAQIAEDRATQAAEAAAKAKVASRPSKAKSRSKK